MSFTIVKSDITKIKADAIVNPTDTWFSGSGGTDKAVHRAAGESVRAELEGWPRLGTGEVYTTSAGNLPCKYIIHTAGPIYSEGLSGESILLRSCFDKALAEAVRLECKSIAFPLIASGSFGFPKGEALKIANESISNFLMEHDMKVILVLYDEISYHLSQNLIDDIKSYVNENYEPEPDAVSDEAEELICNESQMPVFASWTCGSAKNMSLVDDLNNLDESFQEMLLRKIDESDWKASQVYNRANITKEHFYKIRHNKNYSPEKKTVCAFAIALRHDMKETEELLEKAGYALSRSSKFDVIIRYFIESGNYDIFEINEVLYDFDQELLGL
ncbi:MAG: macro domain-containing protein [Lachnospiraceae bacterium]|nr:macro domain-containing protein [Lachnospiraceae bacterium]